MPASRQDITDLREVLCDIAKGVNTVVQFQANVAPSQRYTDGLLPHVENTPNDIYATPSRPCHCSLPVQHRAPAKLSLEVDFCTL